MVDEPTVAPGADAKERRLLAWLGQLPSCIVAFSGGVDSTYLAWAAQRALGGRARAITAFSPSFPSSQKAEVERLAGRIGIAHGVIASGETRDPRYLENNGDRCYWCKSDLYDRLGAIAALGANEAVLDGTNADDLTGHRPGRRAAAERVVGSPLAEVGLTKDEIRWLSRRAGLPTWSRPASPCLSSRVPYGTSIDEATLARIDRAEEAVRALGLREFRVRHHGLAARLEVAAAELDGALRPDLRERLAAAIRGAGYQSATIDLEPFRSGRLSDALRG